MVPVISDKHCTMLRESYSVNSTFILRLEQSLYENRQRMHLKCIADVARNNTDSILYIPSTINGGALLARIKRPTFNSSLIRPKLTMLFNFVRNRKVSGTILSTDVNVWLVGFLNLTNPSGFSFPDNGARLSHLGVSEVNAVSGPSPSEFEGLAGIPDGIVRNGSGAFRCTAFHAGKPIRVLLDTGACASFVGPVLVESLKLHTSPGKLNIHSAGGQSIKALRFVPEFSVILNFSEYFAKLWVVQIPHNIDIILGCDWLHVNGVMIDMAERSAHFKTRVGKIIPEINGHVFDSSK